MRISFIVHRFPPNFLGGADLWTYHVADELRKRNHHVSVICTERTDDQTVPDGTVRAVDEPFDGLDVHRYYFNWRSMPDAYSAFYVINPAIEAATFLNLQQFQPDIVHITALDYLSAGVLTAAQKLRLPVVMTLTGKWLICPKGSLLKQNGSLCAGRQDAVTCLECMFGQTKAQQILARLPDHINVKLIDLCEHLPILQKHSESIGLLQAVQKRNRIFPDLVNQVDYVISPSVCHQDIFRRSEIFGNREIVHSIHGHRLGALMTSSSKTPSSRVRFGYTGQIVDYKGIDVAIEAFLMLKDTMKAELHIYGNPDLNPPYANHLLKMAAGHSNIHFRGPYAHTEIEHILKRLDVVLIPSRCIENAPLTIAEAFAARTPVIGSDTCGVAEWIADGMDGLLFRRGDPNDLAEKMQLLLDRPELLDQLRRNIKPPRSIADEVDSLEETYLHFLETHYAEKGHSYASSSYR